MLRTFVANQKQTIMKENQSRFGWEPWANFEAADANGEVWQYENKPDYDPDLMEWLPCDDENAAIVGSISRAIYASASATLIARYPETTVVDQLNDIHYLPGGGANFCLTVTDGTTEHVAAVDLFEFLMWAQADGLIDSYSAEDAHEEVVILPVPDEQQSSRATAQVKRLYVWLQQMPLATFTRAINERPAMWTAFDENMEPINA